MEPVHFCDRRHLILRFNTAKKLADKCPVNFGMDPVLYEPTLTLRALPLSTLLDEFPYQLGGFYPGLRASSRSRGKWSTGAWMLDRVASRDDLSKRLHRKSASAWSQDGFTLLAIMICVGAGRVEKIFSAEWKIVFQINLLYWTLIAIKEL